ncbi:MAG: 3-dehydroquinate synthase [Rhodanobacteraceae bacterium]
MTTIEVTLGQRSYPILIGSGLLADPAQWRTMLHGRHALVVTDETVAPLYLERVRTGLNSLMHSCLVLPEGERHKTLANTARVFDALAALGATRDATVIALGGGVVGDLAGFAAATWMRGIALLQMPTTLLAMIDSSVGGKTGVNIPQGKNLIGAFHQPIAVVADLSALDTLALREFRSGLAEMIKYGAIVDASFLEWIESNACELIEGAAAIRETAIARCCQYKAAIVSRDEREQGERALLNFGHTFAHALEAECGYGVLLHGEAVAIGMLLAARLSARIGLARDADSERLRRLLEGCGLPTAIPSGLSVDALLARMRLDKKTTGDRLRLVLWRGCGRAEIVPDIAEPELRAVLQSAP